VPVVDDDALVRLGTVDMLMQLGYRAEEAPDAETGLERLAAWPQIDVILVDLGLPGMSGGELIAELKRRHPQVRIVIASGQSREGRLRSGVTDDDSVLALEKPFLSRDLKHALDRALRSDPASSQPA
jgi:CheY-like chemotaxis protein